MLRLEALKSVYDRLTDRVVITIMGAVAAELRPGGGPPIRVHSDGTVF